MMMQHILKASKGFSLIESMIALLVMSILAAIAYPSFIAHIERTRRLECMGEMVSFANAVEQYYTLNNTYIGAGGSASEYGAPTGSVFPSECPIDNETKYYDFTIITPTSTTYTLRATPKGKQEDNGFFQLTSTGARGWDKDNDESDAEASWDDR